MSNLIHKTILRYSETQPDSKLSKAGGNSHTMQEIPSPPDPATPSGKIFLAATKLFSEYGFRDTTTRAIASLAGVKQVMLHYYFGSKVDLYEAVLKYEGMTMLAVIFGENPQQKSPAEMLIDTPIRLMEVMHDNPQWASLLRREIADGAGHLRNALKDVSEHGPLGANLHFHDAYLEAVRTGKAVKLPIEAVRECLLAIGYSAIYLAPLISMINERDFHDETVWAEWKLTLSTILKRGLLTSDSDTQGT
ncbi:MAG: TetR/AcrR family transcriptional regulator [Candidatus Cloacimonetes bacterium]|nr:TetR/AcrR family transcriptional regulator [Candidatus Cloacimonadota bacterium]